MLTISFFLLRTSTTRPLCWIFTFCLKQWSYGQFLSVLQGWTSVTVPELHNNLYHIWTLCYFLQWKTWIYLPWRISNCSCAYRTMRSYYPGYFACLDFFVLIEILFFTSWRGHNCRWRAANVDLCSALMDIKQWGFFSGHTYCDTGHPFIMIILRTRDTHTYCRVFSSGAVTACFYDLGPSRLGF